VIALMYTLRAIHTLSTVDIEKYVSKLREGLVKQPHNMLAT